MKLVRPQRVLPCFFSLLSLKHRLVHSESKYQHKNYSCDKNLVTKFSRTKAIKILPKDKIMEVLIDCYFDRLFEEMERNCLVSRHKRRQLVKYFSDVISSVSKAESLDTGDVCERIVKSALRYHNISMSENGSVCLLGKFHNVLYIAAKLCYDWSLNNNRVVSRLLNDIYYCEKTFERIFVGAIFGIRVTHFLSGWKSDFDNRDENIKALIYFLDHAVDGRLEYMSESSTIKRRFIDVPMESYGQVLPLRVAVQHGAPDILLVMLRYGASTESDKLSPSPLEILLGKFSEYEGEHENDLPAIPENLIICLRLLLRTVPIASVRTPPHIAEVCGVESVTLWDQFPDLVEKNLIRADRSGYCPAELRHLCRCKIRQCLYDNWALPHGIRMLQIPRTLQNYLDLLYD